MVLILKGGGDFGGIGLIEVFWKTILTILNRRLGAAIVLHITLHGFQAGLGAGTVSLKANLMQQLTDMR